MDSAFAAEYSGTLRKLQKLAERFAADMAGLYQDGTSVTLTHGELQDISGDHVRCFNGAPMLIDWGFGRLAPFYIDLVDFFPPEETWLYWEELRRRGIAIQRGDFEECCHMASLYPVFIYLYPALAQYAGDRKEKLHRLLSILSRY